MERAEALILKLQEQFRRKESAAQLLATVQLLQQELSRVPAQEITATKERSKVSVVMPFRPAPVPQEPQTPQQPLAPQQAPPQEEKIVQTLQVDEAEVVRELEQIRKAAEMKNEISLKARPMFQEPYDPIEDIPTLASHIPLPVSEPKAEAEQNGKPRRPVIEFEESGPKAAAKELNEKLKETTREVAQKLQEVPIRDLRKAIGINDRYLFINELFNGDEAMFERSVKTLNQFSILPEAEFWMQRELRIKLGWKEENPLVDQFVSLVRRRFS
jgi:hypothetical protein